MRVLVLNCGSSSLKFRLVAVGADDADRPSPALRSELGGSVAGIGGRATLSLRREGGAASRTAGEMPDHASAVRWVMDHLPHEGIAAVGHRIVHGGDRFRQPVQVDAEVLRAIEALSELAPLHNPAGVAGIRAARAVLGGIPMVAVFDTAFHRTLPPRASTYAIPRDLAARHGIRRYGFHGIAHASLVAGYAAQAGRPAGEGRLITLHLGNGCSAAAIRSGECVDTSMGFTPLEGLVMGTRSGDLDPSVVSYLAHREGMSAGEVERWLNERCGLLGVSGLSHDMRVLQAAAAEDPGGPAALAIELFCYRARKYLGAYLAVLGGAEAVLFGGGIGEHAPAIRARICQDMGWCGLSLDPARNAAAVGLPPGGAARIGSEEASVAAYVVAVDEETEIARQTARCLAAGP